MIKKPLAFYKGVKGRFGAAQFELTVPHLRCSKCRRLAKPNGEPDESCGKDHESKLVPRYGHIMLDITSATAPNTYDWDNKIRFALGVDDVGKMVHFLRTAKAGDSLELFHDPGKGSNTESQVTKTLSLSTPKGLYEGGCLLKVSQNNQGKDPTSHMVPLSVPETMTLQIALSAAIPKIIGW